MSLYSKIINEVANIVKKEINEAFDFDSANKEKKPINIFPQIRELIKIPYKKLTQEEKEFLKSMKNFMPIVKPISKMELKAIISRSIKLFGPDCDLNWLNTSDITNMSNILKISNSMVIYFSGIQAR